MNIFSFDDMAAAVQSADNGDVLLFNIRNSILFTGALLINKGVTIDIVNGSGDDPVILAIAAGGAFRHFTTGGVAINNVTVNVGPGVSLDGMDAGGGIQLYGSGCRLTLSGCTLTNCYNGGNGGAVLLQGNISRSGLVINNVIIEHCQARAGGGIFASACDIEMNGGAILGNLASSTGGGIATVAGGGALGCTLSISGGRVANNAVTAGDGGGITAHDTLVTIAGGDISNNTADTNGGGIYSFNQSGNVGLNALIITNSTLTGNTIRNFGGGIRTENELREFTIIDSVISGNKAASTAAGSYQGGGIYVGGGSLTIISSVVSHNEAGGSGGGIFINLASLVLRGGTEISENIAAITAGGIYGYQGVNITIEEGARIVNNHALCGNDPENASRGGGGIALLSYGFTSTLTVRGHAVIADNTSVSYGGGVWTYPTYGPETTVNIEDAVIEGNTANYGGGISMGEMPGFMPVLTLAGATVSGNAAATDGGGIIAKGSLVTVSGSAIINNAAGRDGGGIFTDALANVTVDATSAFGGNAAGSYAFWTLTSGGDSDIHYSHIFTDRFSMFIPVQTPPPEAWSFTNAYNNYDISYVRPELNVTVVFSEAFNPSHILHTTILDSFLGATVTIPPRETFTDINGTTWQLHPPGQPAQTLLLTDPEADYVVTFYSEPSVSDVTVTEYYVDTRGRHILNTTQTVVAFGGQYDKAAPGIPGYAFVGFMVDNGPLERGQVRLTGLSADTVVTFVYARRCVRRCRCHIPNPCALYFCRTRPIIKT